MHAKGMELGFYDPRAIKGMALAYATGPRGSCHHAGGYVVGVEASSNPKFDRLAEQGKSEIVRFTRGIEG